MQRSGLLILRRIDPVLLVSTTLLVIFGLVILYSTGIKYGPGVNQLDTSRQFLYVFIGFVLMIITAKTDYNVLKNYAKPIYLISVALLLVVEVFGATKLGATRWINFGFFQFQPSEFAKLALIIMLSWFFAKYYDHSQKPKYFIQSVIILLIPLTLVLAQPDLGTGLVLSVIWLSIVSVSKFPKRYLLLMAVLGMLLIPIAIPRLAPYQQERIKTFLNPTANPATTGYNVNQAIIAVGSGGLFGQGLGSGSQSQGNFLPSQHTDFIFAVLSEKMGFFGSLACIVLFSTLIIRIIMIGKTAGTRFGTLLCYGIATMFLFHTFVNIGMNIGLVPVTGIPLPFISAGGTSMIISLLAVGIVLSVHIRGSKVTVSDKEVYDH